MNRTSVLFAIAGLTFISTVVSSAATPPPAPPTAFDSSGSDAHVPAPTPKCDARCKECRSGICEVCKASLYLLKVATYVTCTTSCPSGTWANNATWSCSPCPIPCLTCSGSAGHCDSCDQASANKFLRENRCETSCGDGWFAGAGNVCSPCVAECLTCSGAANDCTSCNASFLQSNSCVATCSNGTFGGSDNVCRECDASCRQCSGNSTTCTSCWHGKFLDGGKCSSCPGNVLPSSIAAQSSLLASLAPEEVHAAVSHSSNAGSLSSGDDSEEHWSAVTPTMWKTVTRFSDRTCVDATTRFSVATTTVEAPCAIGVCTEGTTVTCERADIDELETTGEWVVIRQFGDGNCSTLKASYAIKIGCHGTLQASCDGDAVQVLEWSGDRCTGASAVPIKGMPRSINEGLLCYDATRRGLGFISTSACKDSAHSGAGMTANASGLAKSTAIFVGLALLKQW